MLNIDTDEQERLDLSNRVNEAISSMGRGGKVKISKMCDVTPQSVNGWIKTGRIGKENIAVVSSMSGYSLNWLITGKGDKLNSVDRISIQVQQTGPSNTEPGPDITGRVPLISWVQAGQWSEIIDNHHPGDAEEWRLTTAKVSKNAFALRVVGDSMTNPHGYPSLPPGVIVIIEPNRSAKNGDIVIARLEDSMEATIKKLVIDGHQKFLKPLNPHYPVIEINGNCTICGVAVKVEMDL